MKLWMILIPLALLLTACAGVPGPAGPQGLQGLQGLEGPQGPMGPTGPDGSAASESFVPYSVPVQVYCGGTPETTNVQAAVVVDGRHLDIYGDVPAQGCNGTIFFVPDVGFVSGYGSNKLTKGVCTIETTKKANLLASAAWIQTPNGKAIVCAIPSTYLGDSDQKLMTGLYPNSDKHVELTIPIP